ncbi:uncharacterized protein DS421_11g343980 [Arachis hypogaea]|nr:uncharacterized protein DS421_11g343980 [Arachis hypogaea]
MHGNVKGQNDLVIAQGAKIADFGCALRVVADGEGVIPGHRRTRRAILALST